MQFNAEAAVGAGLMAALVTLFALAPAMLIERSLRLNPIVFLGGPFRCGAWLRHSIGLVTYAGLSIALAFVYGAILSGFNVHSSIVEWGVLIGIGQWMVLGGFLLALCPLHPRIKDGSIVNPGPFFLNLTGVNGLGFLVLNILFGIIAGFFFDALR